MKKKERIRGTDRQTNRKEDVRKKYIIALEELFSS